MPGHDIVIGFSAGGVEALARLPNILRRSGEFPVLHSVHEPSLEYAPAEHM
jgi:chemotaxis response regulator CheB